MQGHAKVFEAAVALLTKGKMFPKSSRPDWKSYWFPAKHHQFFEVCQIRFVGFVRFVRFEYHILMIPVMIYCMPIRVLGRVLNRTFCQTH